MTLRVIFAGTPEFALPSLQHLVEHDFQIISVLTQPDRPKGRGRKLSAPPVKQFAELHNFEVIQPERITTELIEELARLKPDVMVVVAFGLILPPALLDLPRFGCINVHASLLPRWRGAAPIARAIEAGDSKTGVTIMHMDSGLDTGPMLSRVECPIESDATTASLHDHLAELGAPELLKVLNQLPGCLDNAAPQNECDATYAAKLHVTEAAIDWQTPAAELVRKIHALNPWPIARTVYQDLNLRIWQVEECATLLSAIVPGEVIESNRQGIVVGTGQGAVRILCLQREGKRKMSAADFLSGCAVQVGSKFS